MPRSALVFLRTKLATLLFIVLACVIEARPAHAADPPGRVDIGTYVNGIQDLSFKDSKYVIDFYIWFRWVAAGPLREYKPLESIEIINGKIDNKGSIVEKKLGEVQYLSARISATMSEPWELRAFPFDRHRIVIKLEDSGKVAQELVFAEDHNNSRIGDEVKLSGWNVKNFTLGVADNIYKTNYGDISLPRDAESIYSRYSFAMDLQRDGYGVAFKILSIVILSTLCAFVAFLVKPNDLDPRFGLGVGALFAVAASEFIVSSLIPDSGVMTLADQVHMLAMGLIFVSLLLSAYSLRLSVTERVAASDRLDRWCAVSFPALFTLALVVMIVRAM